MLTRPDILRPRLEVRGQGQDQRARGRDRGQRFEAKAKNEAQIVCKKYHGPKTTTNNTQYNALD